MPVYLTCHCMIIFQQKMTKHAKRQDKTQSEETKQTSELHSYMMRKFHLLLVRIQNGTLWKIVWHKLNIVLSYELIIILLGIYPIELKTISTQKLPQNYL